MPSSAARAGRWGALPVRALAFVRRKTVMMPLVGTASFSVLAVCMSLIYIGGLWDPAGRLDNVPVALLNADTPATRPGNVTVDLGKLVVEALGHSAALRWHVLSDHRTLGELRDSVWRNHYFGGLYIPEGFSSSFAKALSGKGTNRTASYANTMVYVDDLGKQYSTSAAVESVVSSLAQGLALRVAHGMLAGTFGPVAESCPADAWAAPLGLRVASINAGMKTGWFLTQLTSLVFLNVASLICVFAAVSLFHLRMTGPSGVRVSRAYVVAMRFTVLLASVPCDCAAIVAVLRALRMPVAHGYGALWATYMLAQLSLGAGVVFPLITCLGLPGRFSSILLLMVQIVSSSGPFDLHTIGEGWGAVGRLLPMYHAVRLLRHVEFDALPEEVGEHVGALLAWVVGGALLTTLGTLMGLWDRNMKKDRTHPVAST
eukprot:m51a1_g4865 hypothetical protein (430) ;mRNA; r:337355-338848